MFKHCNDFLFIVNSTPCILKFEVCVTEKLTLLLIINANPPLFLPNLFVLFLADLISSILFVNFLNCVLNFFISWQSLKCSCSKYIVAGFFRYVLILVSFPDPTFKDLIFMVFSLLPGNSLPHGQCVGSLGDKEPFFNQLIECTPNPMGTVAVQQFYP